MKFIPTDRVVDYEAETGLTEDEWSAYLRYRTYKHITDYRFLDFFETVFDKDDEVIEQIDHALDHEAKNDEARFLALFEKRLAFFQRVKAVEPTRFFITPQHLRFIEKRNSVAWFEELGIPLRHIIFRFERVRLQDRPNPAHDLIVFGYNSNMLQLVSDDRLDYEENFYGQTYAELTGLDFTEWMII